MHRRTVASSGLTEAVLLVALLLGATLAGTRTTGDRVSELAPDIRYSLRTAEMDGRRVFVGVGSIDGAISPTLHAQEGQIVKVTLENGDSARHGVAFPAKSSPVASHGAISSVILRADHAGDFV